VFDRRIARKVDADGNGVFETTQRFVYDGEDLILAFSGTTNVLTNRSLYGPATDEILADEKITTGTAGTVTWSLGDNLGTIRDLVHYNALTGTTSVVNHVRYDTFGQIVGQTNSAFQPFFAYTGREWDPAVGLYFYRARWYDPRAGRFLSEDPIGFAAGDANLSRYVGNGPTLWVDPSGMNGSEPRVTPDQMNAYLHAPLNWAFSNGWRPSNDTNFGDFAYMRVTADRTLWEWWTNAPPDVLGIVLYNPKEEYGKQLADETARLMRTGRGLSDIHDHISMANQAASIAIQMANDPLDIYISFRDFKEKPTARNFASAMMSMFPIVSGSVFKCTDNLTDIGKAEEMAKLEALSVRISDPLDDIPIMSPTHVKASLPNDYSKSTRWAYSIHEHHLYPKWLGGKEGGPIVRIRGFEHITDLEPALVDFMKGKIPGLTQKSAAAIRDLIRTGRLTQDTITAALLDFYTARFPTINRDVLLDRLRKGLAE
jgi:RHS repeat-associated protein